MTTSQLEEITSFDDINLQDVKEDSSVVEVLKNTTFMFLFAAQFSQNVGAAVSWLALQFLILGLTGSPGLMGFLSIVFWLPYVMFTPFAGVYTDRFDQRKIMLIANLISFIATCGFILVYLLKDILTIETITTTNVGGIITVTHSLSYIHIIWPLFVFTFINSTASSFFFPARSAYTRYIVKKKNLLVANSIGTTVFQIATIVGYVLAGVLAARSYLWSFIFDASTFAISFTMVLFIVLIGKKPPGLERPPDDSFRAQVKGIIDDIKIGFRTIRATPKVAYMLIIFASAIFTFSSFNVLFIIVLGEEMGLNETWYGIMQAIMGISGIITALILMKIGKIKRKIMMLNIALASLAVVLMLFAFIRNIWGIGVILFFLGIGLVMINIPAPTLIQEQIPYEKQGRVFGTQQLIQGIARIVGMGIVSIVAEYVKTMYVFIVASSFMMIVMIWGFFYSNRKGISGSDYLENGEAKISMSD